MNRLFASFRRISAILRKEFIQLKRDRATFAMIIMIPIVQLMLFGYAINSDPKHLLTAVLSRDNSPIARSFITGLKNSEYFYISQEIKTEEEGHLLLQQGKMQFVISIPENFHRNLIRGAKPALLIEADATDPTAISGALGAVEGVLDRVIKRDLKGPLSMLDPSSPPFSVTVHKRYNPEGFTRYNIVPGLVGIILTMTGILMTAMALARERERGTMENLLSMPSTPFEIMVGKMTPYIFIGYIQAFIIIVTARFLFGVPILGSISLLCAILLVFIMCNLALGFTISTWARSQMQAAQMSIMLLLPSLMLSGFLFPFQGMPTWAQMIGRCIPMTYFVRIIRSIMLKGGAFVEIWPNVWPLLIFMVVITAITLKVYRKTLD